jgi:hypothetical protein
MMVGWRGRASKALKLEIGLKKGEVVVSKNGGFGQGRRWGYLALVAAWWTGP